MRHRYAREVSLRDVFARAGSLRVVEDPAAGPSAAEAGQLWPRAVFVPAHSQHVAVGWERPGVDIAREDEEQVYLQVVGVAAVHPEPEDVAQAAVSAIESLRASGRSPDVVLLPRNPRARPLLARHPQFDWSSDFLQQTNHFGTLAGVPVYDAGPADAQQLIVAELGAALERIELRRPSDDSSIWIDVRGIDADRAQALTSEQADEIRRAELAPELVAARVEVFAGLTTTYERHPEAGAALVIPLPADVLQGKRSLSSVLQPESEEPAQTDPPLNSD